MSDSCVSKVATAGVSGFGLGTLVGALNATWQDVPAVMRNQSWPALAKTGGMMASAGATFSLIGGVYAGVACATEGARGKADFWNGVCGGLAAGQVIGMRGRSLGLGIGAGAAFAAASAAVDATGHKIRGDGGFDDGATPGRIYFPYKSKS